MAQQQYSKDARLKFAPWQPALLSAILPGSGQFLLGQRWRGIGLFVGLLLMTSLVLWLGSGVGFIVGLGQIWLWNIWDAYKLASGRRSRLWAPVIIGAIIIYAIGIQVTDVRFDRLITGWPSMQPYLKALVNPEFMEYPTEDIVGLAPIQVPCIEPLPEPEREATDTPSLYISSDCASIDEFIELEGEGYFPDFEGEMWWNKPIGDSQRLIEEGKPVLFLTDETGRFAITIQVPLAVPLTQIPAEGETQTHVIRAEQHRPYGSLQPTQTLALVLEKILETIAIAFLATVLGVIFAVPVSFLAARNLMEGHRLTRAIYYVVRTILNIVRSLETLMWAIVFAVWVGLGPFGGMLALWLHTVAALGKLYSEAIESIDPGPIEAVRATGARGPQIVIYAVLPQIMPSFTSYTLYRWDINVRMSTVIGLVSDAGLGFLVIQWIRLNRFSSMATAIIAIILVIATLDFISSKLRQRIIEGVPSTQKGNPSVRLFTRALIVIGFLAAFIWSWQVSKVEMLDLVRGAPDGLRLLGAFASPDIIERPTEELSVSQELPVPCGVTEVAPAVLAGPRLNLSRNCGDVGEPLTIIGHELPPDTDVSIRWVMPDGAFLRIKSNCCTTDPSGAVRLETQIHPLLELDPEQAAGGLGGVAITWKEVVGGPQISENFKIVLELAVQTLLMALLATTIGTLFAIPLSFLAARNIMGNTRVGRIFYTLFRTSFNIFRSIEPMILVLIAAAWVGAGPFAGVLALSLNIIPNLGKLFSEKIEEIDEGPVEAVTATGAAKLQVLVFAIAPQLVPQFLAYILYQWDINIRMSTVIGFVGGGGIGQQFRLWVGLNQYAAAGAATLAIVLMVWTMDYLSAKAREKLI